MLRKLMKYELRATARVMLPLYLAVAGLAAALRLLLLWSDHFSAPSTLLIDPVTLLLRLVTVAFILAMVAVPVAALVLMIVRFKSNLLSDEGYVMFTLPTSPHKLVWSKLLTSAIWFIGAAAVDIAGVLILSADMDLFTRIWNGFQSLFSDLTAYYAANGILVIVEVVILILLVCFSECLEFYCPMAIGHSFARHKILMSVVFYFVIQAVTQVAGVVLATAGVPLLDDLSTIVMGLPSAVMLHGGIWLGILIVAVYGGILYAITIRMLRRHLNLD